MKMTISISQKQERKIEEYVQINREKHILLVEIADTIRPLMEKYHNLEKQMEVITEQVPRTESLEDRWYEILQEKQWDGTEVVDKQAWSEAYQEVKDPLKYRTS